MSIYNSELTVGVSAPVARTVVFRNINDVTVILGRNGSGKSQILRSIHNTDKAHYHYVNPEKGGDFSFRPEFLNEQSSFETRGSKRGGSNIAPTFREEAVSRLGALLTQLGVATKDGSTNVDLNYLEELIGSLIPEWTFSITKTQPHFEIRRIIKTPDATRDEGISSVNVLSSGEAAILDIGLDVVTICAIWQLENASPKTLLIDEADLHLHYDLQQKLAEFIMKVVDAFNVQIIVATHSTALLAALGHFGGERTSVVYIDPNTSVQDAKKFTKTLQDTATLLGGHALMGPLFGYPVLLVEGDDDYKVWSLAARYQILKVSVLPTEGSPKLNEYAASLNNIFGVTLDPGQSKPSAYALYDNDHIDDNDITSNHQFVKKIRIKCHEVENLYLADETLHAIGIASWEDAKQLIETSKTKYGVRKQRIIERVLEEDRKTVDLKNIMEQLVDILDEKKVDWRVRLSAVIGLQKPEGQLAEFLGSQVIEELWGF